MDKSSLRSERITAILSTVVAVAILAAGVTAHQSHNVTTEDSLSLLESDLRFQIDMAFRQNPGEGAARMSQVDEAVSAWHASPQSEIDRSRMADWLLEATIRCMPGTMEALPEVPRFGLPQEESVTSTPEVNIAEDTYITLETTEDATLEEEEETAPHAEAEQRAAMPVAAETAVTVPINTTVLSDRMAEYHSSLDKIQSRLLIENTSDLIVLTSLVEKVEASAADYHLLGLYYEALTEQERSGIQKPRPVEPVLSELQQRIQRARPDDAGRTPSTSQLDALFDRVDLLSK